MRSRFGVLETLATGLFVASVTYGPLTDIVRHAKHYDTQEAKYERMLEREDLYSTSERLASSYATLKDILRSGTPVESKFDLDLLKSDQGKVEIYDEGASFWFYPRASDIAFEHIGIFDHDGDGRADRINRNTLTFMQRDDGKKIIIPQSSNLFHRPTEPCSLLDEFHMADSVIETYRNLTAISSQNF